jgi:hypothetical protein
MRATRIGPAVPWVLLGFAGSLAIAISGHELAARQVSAWWLSTIPRAHGLAPDVFDAGMVALVVAWLAIGRRCARFAPADLWPVAILWSAPLLLAGPLFSHDVNSYLAQGTLAHLGANPYKVAPAALSHLGAAGVLHRVDPFWRHTTAPYGPLFVTIARAAAAVTGAHVSLGIALIRAIDIGGVALTAWYLPRLARATGADPARATWLAILSPLMLLQVVAAGHNDGLMVGCLVAGLAYALEGRLLLGIALCAVAAAIKIPAVVGVAFISVYATKAALTPQARARALAGAAAVTAAVLGLISAIGGFGLSWLTSGLFSTPAKVRLAITPATAVARTLGVGSLSLVALLLVGLLALVLLWRVQRHNVVACTGALLLALALGGPAAWPWYLVWGVVLLAASPGAQRSLPLVAGVAAAALLVDPSGILVLSISKAPDVVVAYAVGGALALAWHAWQLRDRRLAQQARNTAWQRSPLLAES